MTFPPTEHSTVSVNAIIAHPKSMCAIYTANKLKYIKTNNNYSLFPQLCSIFAERLGKNKKETDI